MAKRKKQTAVELVSQLVLILAFISAAMMYLSTNSIAAAIVVWLSIMVVTVLLNILAGSMRKERLRRSGINDVDKMTGVQFEEFLKALYKRRGYVVKGTPVSGDFGADLLLEKENVRIVVQAKRYKSNVGIKAVQEVMSAKTYYNAQQAWVVTNSQYTDAAKKLALKCDVRMIARNELIELMLQQSKKRSV